MNKIITSALLFNLIFPYSVFAATTNAVPIEKKEKVSAAAVGWGNLIVPGLGATLQDKPLTGLTEAALELGSFYGGTSLGRESRFKIDGSIDPSENTNVGKASAARMLQQFGLKYHFYNTFYHYQQAAIENEDTPKEQNNPQPLYRGTWKDMLEAPFRWDNLKSTWTWPIVLAVGTYLIVDYSGSTTKLRRSGISGTEQALYGATQMAAVPIGSSFGEDPLFRGFIQREVHGMSNSLTLAVLSQTALFSLLHEDHVTSFAVGSYFGIEAHALKGDLGPMMAAHFWINVIIGMIDFFQMRRSINQSAPLNPKVSAVAFTIPI